MFFTKRIVQSSDCTSNRLMKFGAFVRFMSDCEQCHIDCTGEISDFFKLNGIGIFLVSRQLDIFRRPNFLDELQISTYAYEMKPLSGARNTLIVDAQGNHVAASYSVGAFVDLKTGKLVKLPKDYLDVFPFDAKQEMEYLPRKIQIPKDAVFAERQSFLIPSDFIDFYQHTNNANYVVAALECVPDNFEVKRIRMEFKAPTVCGDKITSEVAETKNGFIVVLKKDGVVCNISEFV